MLDYKSIIIKRYALGLSYKELAEEFSASKSGINDFIRAFERCEKLSYPLPEGITNYAIYELVYGHEPGTNRRNDSYEQPDFPTIFKQMNERKNMTLVYLWSRYQKDCIAKAAKPYQYRQFCELYGRWCRENCETLHIQAVIGQKMEVDFAGKTFELIDKLTGEITTIVVFVAVLPYSQYIYAEGMVSSCEPQWIEDFMNLASTNEAKLSLVNTLSTTCFPPHVMRKVIRLSTNFSPCSFFTIGRDSSGRRTTED